MLKPVVVDRVNDAEGNHNAIEGNYAKRRKKQMSHSSLPVGIRKFRNSSQAWRVQRRWPMVKDRLRNEERGPGRILGSGPRFAATTRRNSMPLMAASPTRNGCAHEKEGDDGQHGCHGGSPLRAPTHKRR
jgi:hypothetical protein